MRAGQLNKRVTLEEPDLQIDSYGDAIPDLPPLQTIPIWASIRPLTGRELIEAAQLKAEVTHKVIIRWRSDVQPTWHIVFNGRVLEITSIINVDEHNRDLELLCVERL